MEVRAIRMFVALVVLGPAARSQECEAAWTFDGGLAGWTLDHDLVREPSEGGPLVLRSTGADPYLSSPPLALARPEFAWELEVAIEWRLERADSAQVFWESAAGEGFSEPKSQTVAVQAGAWNVASVIILDSLCTRLRIDPGNLPGKIEIRSVSVRPASGFFVDGRVEGTRTFSIRGGLHAPRTGSAVELRLLPDPETEVVTGPPDDDLRFAPGGRRALAWRLRARRGGLHVLEIAAGPRRFRLSLDFAGSDEGPDAWTEIARADAEESVVLDHGPAVLKVSRRHAGGARLDVRDEGGTSAAFGILAPPDVVLGGGDGPPWLPVFDACRFAGDTAASEIVQTASATGPGGLRADLTWRFIRGPLPGVFDVETTLAVSAPSTLLHWEAIALRPGFGSFGARHDQALFGGLEYLDAPDVSSSAADNETPARIRFLPDPLKVTVPLMALGCEGRHAALAFPPLGPASPLFAAPDRPASLHDERSYLGGPTARSSRMSLVVPAVGRGRAPNRMLADAPLALDPGAPLRVTATLMAGPGHEAAAALKTWVRLNPLPTPPPRPRRPAEEYRFLARSLLDSALWDPERNGYGHCVEPEWGRDPCADIAGVLLRFAAEVPDAPLAARLRERAESMLAAIPPARRAAVTKTHAFLRAAPFLAGGLDAALDGLEIPEEACQWSAIEPHVRRSDALARTHWSDTAAGLLAAKALEFLEAARFTGDGPPFAGARWCFAAMARHELDGKVPRGAQTWEVPLHTPDILAAARAVLAFVTAYEIEGRAEDLARAAAWAWTGIPFVYLWDRPDLPVMRYATVPVYGATHYRAPDWIGLPVQWCGLGYAEALYRLARHDASGPWLRLADGIVISALQQLVPDGPARGCLPDSFALAPQRRQGPMINPASVAALVLELDRKPPLLGFARAKATGILVHAPGRIEVESDAADELVLRLDAPASGPFEMVLLRCSRPTRMTLDGEAVPLEGAPDAPLRAVWREAKRRLILRLPRGGRIVVRFS